MTEIDSVITPNKYDAYLLNLIKDLKSFKFCEGSEGFAYFVSDQFVVKEYSKNFPSRNPVLFDSIFDLYCKEIQRFYDEGYTVPKIYSWLKVPNTNKADIYMGKAMPFKYYVLEENVPGRWIYYHYENLNEMYQACKDLCSEDTFSEALINPNGRVRMKKAILKAYISDYIKMNQKLESMSENEFEKFVVSAYKMASCGLYSGPDLFRKNVLVDESRITLIDNRFRDNMGWMKGADIDEYFLLSIIDLMSYNKNVEENLLLNSIDFSLYDESIGKLIRENRAICTALMQKILNTLNKKMQINPVSHTYIYEDIAKMISDTILDDVNQVLPLVQTRFEME